MSWRDMMTSARNLAVRALLEQAEAAHAVFEREELDGVYDEAWPQWYAAWAWEHGFGQRLASDSTVDVLAATFATTWEEIQREDPGRDESWATHMARRLVQEG